MSDFHRTHPFRIYRLLLLVMFTVIGLSILWEFKLERWVLPLLGLPYDGSFENGERWRFVLTSTGFSLLSLILPTLVLRRLIRNTRISYWRLQKMQSQAETLAKHDALSGLFNRRVFMALLGERLAQVQPAVVMLIDLDHFKAINDQHGHTAGDQVLIKVAGHLDEVARAHGGVAARLGGDEFCLLLTEKKEEHELRTIADAIIQGIAHCGPDSLAFSRFGATLGIARSWLDAHDASTLLHYADVAMYKGKDSGRSTYHFYSTDFERQRLAQFDSDLTLKRAVEQEEIVPYFQPIVAFPSQEVVGFEILARWARPDASIVMPTDFIPALERLGLVPAMTRSLIRQACKAARGWDDNLRLSLNVTPGMITDELFPDRLLEQLRQENFPCERFEVEITEEALVGNLQAAQKNLNRLHEHGITVALDDFGTGYSGLYHLTRLSIDKIKIDRSFFESGDEDHLPVVEAILGMARSLKMKVTAEGIEDFHSPDLPSWLASNGCDFAQGYLYGHPRSSTDINSAVHGDEVRSALGTHDQVVI